jgi:hypothetical protein
MDSRISRKRYGLSGWQRTSGTIAACEGTRDGTEGIARPSGIVHDAIKNDYQMATWFVIEGRFGDFCWNRVCFDWRTRQDSTAE